MGARTRAELEPLSRARLVATALALIDRDGLEAFSMRNLARELGVTPGALYHHVADRDTLLQAVTAAVQAEIAMPDADTAWEQRLRGIAAGYRAAVHAHPGAAALLSSYLVTHSSAGFQLVEAVLDTLEQARVPSQALLATYNATVGAIVGYVGLELAAPPRDDPQGWAERRRRELADVDGDRHPRMASHRGQLERGAFAVRWRTGVEQPLDDGFDALCDMLVAGIRATGDSR